jgi:hypothetical protein
VRGENLLCRRVEICAKESKVHSDPIIPPTIHPTASTEEGKALTPEVLRENLPTSPPRLLTSDCQPENLAA